MFKFSLFFVDVCFACIPVLKELICLYCEIQCVEFITGANLVHVLNQDPYIQTGISYSGVHIAQYVLLIQFYISSQVFNYNRDKFVIWLVTRFSMF